MHTPPTVYLAGPISGLSFTAAQNWRDLASDMLAPSIEAFSPLRAKEFLRQVSAIEDSYAGTPLSTDRGIMTRDHRDVQNCDLVLCNLLGAKRISIGTMFELGWAFAYRKPVVLVIEAEGNLHDYPMVREATSFRTAGILEAVDVTRAVLLSKPKKRPDYSVGATRDPRLSGGSAAPFIGHASGMNIRPSDIGAGYAPTWGGDDVTGAQPFARGHTAAVAARDLGAGDRVRSADFNVDSAGVARESV